MRIHKVTDLGQLTPEHIRGFENLFTAAGKLKAVTSLNSIIGAVILVDADGTALTANTITGKITVRNAAQPYEVLDSTGDQSIDGTERTLNLDSETITHSNYTLASDEITVTAAGTYFVNYHIVWDTTNTAGGSPHVVETHCEKITAGPAYANINASYARTYAIESPTGTAAGSVGTSFMVELGIDEGVRVRMDRVAGTTNIDTTQNYSKLCMMRVSD